MGNCVLEFIGWVVFKVFMKICFGVVPCCSKVVEMVSKLIIMVKF